MADNMMRIAGRSETGLAKAIKTDDSGNVGVELTKSKVEVLKYNKTTPPSEYYTTGFFEPRDTAVKTAFLSHATIGVFEQSFAFRNTLNATVELKISFNIDAGEGNRSGAVIWKGDIPTDARFFFTTDKSESVNVGESGFIQATRQIINLVELRLPYPQFILDITPKSIPTTGEIMIQNIRRF